MSSPNIAEIKRRADIQKVWSALGGSELRKSRGQAFWRGGDGYSVSLDLDKGLWHDFVSGTGGDVVELVRTVQECGFLQAAEWLAAHTGVRVSEWIRRDREAEPTDWATDLKWATWWAMAAEILAEDALESLPFWHRDRYPLTQLLAAIRLGDASMVAEYRKQRQREPQMTAGLARAGRLSDARVQRRLALWLRRYYDGAPEA
jgi:hypothetical protein